MAVGCNVGDRHAMFEPIHGSAPKHAGKDKANPIAMILATAEALKWLGDKKSDATLKTAGDKIESAVRAVVRRGSPLTYDLVGEERASKMSEVTAAVLKELEAGF
jgi:3-isopropylmalate dehydrogenase